MKFIADAMLGRLARWLRLMGYDVHYKSDLGDEEILTNAGERTILTRDRALCAKAKSRGLQVLLVYDTDIKGQLSQVKMELGTELQDTPGFSRCPLCNGEIEKIGEEKVWTCKNCQKIYWEGGHWKNIREMVKDVQDGVEDVQDPKR